MAYAELIEQLAADLRLPGLIPSAEPCAVALDGVEVTFNPHAHEAAFTLRSLLGRLTPANFQAQAPRLLQANLDAVDGQACGLAADPDGNVYLTRFVLTDGLGFDEFRSMLESFVNRAEHWQEELSARAQGA
jgi:hypothetical protein